MLFDLNKCPSTNKTNLPSVNSNTTQTTSYHFQSPLVSLKTAPRCRRIIIWEGVYNSTKCPPASLKAAFIFIRGGQNEAAAGGLLSTIRPQLATIHQWRRFNISQSCDCPLTVQDWSPKRANYASTVTIVPDTHTHTYILIYIHILMQIYSDTSWKNPGKTRHTSFWFQLIISSTTALLL